MLFQGKKLKGLTAKGLAEFIKKHEHEELDCEGLYVLVPTIKGKDRQVLVLPLEGVMLVKLKSTKTKPDGTFDPKNIEMMFDPLTISTLASLTAELTKSTFGVFPVK